MNAIKTTLFIIAIPGSLLIVIPSTILQPIEKNTLDLGIFTWLALPLWLIGLGILVWCATDFVRKGQGTPAPLEAPKRLVITGLYRYSRNPMYVGVLLFAAGNVLWYGSPLMAGYLLCLWLAFHVFILLYEEPHLRQIFGAEYRLYCQGVPRWLPQFRDRQPPKQ